MAMTEKENEDIRDEALMMLDRLIEVGDMIGDKKLEDYAYETFKRIEDTCGSINADRYIETTLKIANFWMAVHEAAKESASKGDD